MNEGIPRTTDFQSVVRQEDIQRIDELLLKEIESRRLELAPAADRRTLLRRLTYDLTRFAANP